MDLNDHVQLAIRLGVAALGGLAVGIEREWSVRRGQHAPHFAGARTFLLLGLVGALGAEFTRTGSVAAGAALLLAAAALIVVAYGITSRRDDVGGTTEVAALIVLAAGVLAGSGRLALASGLFAATALVLIEKGLIHRFVERLQSHELMAAVRFAVLALVIFPLLPTGPFGPAPGFRPRELWALVLAFSGVSFVSFLTLRLVGLHRGYSLVGLLGGLASSTAVTLNFSRESREQPQLGRVLAVGVTAACTVLPLRVMVLISALNPSVGLLTIPYLLPPFAAGLLASAATLRRNDPQTIKAEMPRNPLRLPSALQMAGAFQVVLYAMAWVGSAFGSSGTLLSAALVGLTDVDPLIYSMVKLGGAAALTSTAAQALAVGVLANTLFKLGMALAIGRGSFRGAASFGLLTQSAAGLAALWLFR
ncbi:MAG: DUF4010 domain-containing protein [Candidatus Omnitrophica bacterium]|nr:DUF4010 domain-containing protein [Candidatus Omnitrophota bacterium]